MKVIVKHKSFSYLCHAEQYYKRKDRDRAYQIHGVRTFDRMEWKCGKCLHGIIVPIKGDVCKVCGAKVVSVRM